MKLAKSMTLSYPNDPFAWKILAALLHKEGRLSEGLVANRKLATLVPNDSKILNNLGMLILETGGEVKEALAFFKKAIALQPDYALAYYNVGCIHKLASNFLEALVYFKKAIALQPNYFIAYCQSGDAFYELGRSEEAYDAYQQTIALDPGYADAYVGLARVQSLVPGKLSDAMASYQKALALDPDHKEGAYLVATSLLVNTGEYEKAIKLLKSIGNYRDSSSWILRCLYKLNDPSALYEHLNELFDQEITSAMIGNVCCNAELKYGVPTTNPFCREPINYITHTDLSCQYNFEKIFVQPIRGILDNPSTWYKDQGRLTSGQQTAGNIFSGTNNPQINEIENIIRLEVGNYQRHFKASDEGIIRKFPAKYVIRGWIINMKSGGKLAPHYHEYGWISGSVYVNVPPRHEEDSGNLVLRQGDIEHQANIKETSVMVVTGSLCLFPASLEHFTIPFDSDENRIVIAFDVVPDPS